MPPKARRAARRAPSKCPRAPQPCSSWCKDSAGALVKTQALDTARGCAGLHLGWQHRRRRQRPAGAYKIEVIAKRGRQERFSRTPASRRSVSSVALDPATGALMLDTDSLGEIAMSDVERVL